MVYHCTVYQLSFIQSAEFSDTGMTQNFLDFEQPIADLQAKIRELQFATADTDINISEEIDKLSKKCDSLTHGIFAKLSSWQVAQLARHPQRPYTRFYIDNVFTDFEELHGDRLYGDDQAIVGGLARLQNRPVVVMGHEKGRDTKEKIKRNFGMPRPEGYRKAKRLMELAERFQLPVISLIDTPGAYPGIGAEERGQSEAIARNLFVMSQLKTPIIAIVIGEGGSGGALALGVADRVMMLQYGIYSVISPEGCASILYKSAEKAAEAAEAMGITSERLSQLGLVDRVIDEPLGGAHRDDIAMAGTLKEVLVEELALLEEKRWDELTAERHLKWRNYGQFREA